MCSAQATILIVAQGNPNDPALSNVIEKAAGVQLSKSSTVSVTLPNNAPGSGAGQSPSSAGTATDFLLLIDYAKVGSEIRLQMSLRDPRAAIPVASHAVTLPFTLSFDVGVSDAVARLMAMPGVAAALRDAAKMSKTTASGAAAAAPQEPQGANPAAPGARPSGASAGAAAAPAPHKPAATAPSPPRAAPPASRHAGFTFRGSGTPLILVGNASNYFRYGAGASLHIGIQIPAGRMDFETGLVAGANALIPAVGIAEGMVYALPVGPEVRFGTSPELPVAMGIQASGGAAFIIAQTASRGLEAKTDLFTSGAVTARLRVSRRFVVGTELGILVVFEQRYPIVAIEPTLTFGLSP